MKSIRASSRLSVSYGCNTPLQSLKTHLSLCETVLMENASYITGLITWVCKANADLSFEAVGIFAAIEYFQSCTRVTPTTAIALLMSRHVSVLCLLVSYLLYLSACDPEIELSTSSRMSRFLGGGVRREEARRGRYERGRTSASSVEVFSGARNIKEA